MSAVRIGVDIAKNVFQVHAVTEENVVLHRRKLSRSKFLEFFATMSARAVVGMEACATSHYWARELLKLGHDVRLLPPSAVKPYVARGKKNDAADAQAICEALGRPNIHCVPVKTEAQQGVLALHAVRESLIVERTANINAVRAHFAEHGIVTGVGRASFNELKGMIEGLPLHTQAAVEVVLGRIASAERDLVRIEKALMDFLRTDETSQNLATIPTVGPLAATLIAAKVGDPTRFRRGRDFAAWLGLVPRQNSSGGKERLGRITKVGDRAIRRFLFLGALSVIWRTKPGTWLAQLRAKKPAKVVAIALANKTARTILAVLKRGEVWREQAPLAA